MSQVTYRKLSQLLDLELAWKRINSDKYNDLLPDILDYRDVDYDRIATLDNIKHKLDGGYEPSELLKIDVPKKEGYPPRLGANMVPEDRIVYQAIIDYISKKVEEPPADGVFSYRLNKDTRSDSMFQPWKPQWLEMRRKMRKVYAEGYHCLLRTDIAAYFEHIDHNILRTNILNQQVSEERYTTPIYRSGTAIAIVEEDGTISLFNKVAEELTGYTKEEVEGKMTLTALLPEEERQWLMGYHQARRRDEGAPITYEVKMRRKDGEVRTILTSVGLIPGTRRSITSIIDITEMKRMVQKLEIFEDKQVLDLLDRLLRKWAISDVKNTGIPQGCDASSFLGTIYLISLDKRMKREGFKYFRYSDEIYVLTKDEIAARKVIKVIAHELRKLQLSFQESKTEIIKDPRRVAEKLGSEEEDAIIDFDYDFQRRLPTKDVREPERKIVKRYKETTKIIRAGKIDISKLIWCINRLRMLKSDRAVNFVLKRLAEIPFLADCFFEYLKTFADRENVKEGIVQFLTSPNNIHEWQEMWLLFTLSKADRLDESQLKVVREIIGNDSKHWASRAAAIIVLGKLGNNKDRKWLRYLYPNGNNYYIKRAIAVSMRGLPKLARNRFYTEIEKESYHTRRLVKYLRQRRIQTI